jgi:hypothetical protein
MELTINYVAFLHGALQFGSDSIYSLTTVFELCLGAMGGGADTELSSEAEISASDGGSGNSSLSVVSFQKSDFLLNLFPMLLEEKSASCERENSKPKDLPSRSIGNRFNKKSDFWNDTTDNDEFPEPPSEAEISASEDNSVSAPPPIAPRQSSKTVVKEYIESDPNWSAPWRKAT